MSMLCTWFKKIKHGRSAHVPQWQGVAALIIYGYGAEFSGQSLIAAVA